MDIHLRTEPQNTWSETDKIEGTNRNSIADGDDNTLLPIMDRTTTQMFHRVTEELKTNPLDLKIHRTLREKVHKKHPLRYTTF